MYGLAGYEDLTPDQLIFIAYVAVYIVTVVVVGWIVRAFIHLRTARYIHLRIEKEIVAKVENEIFDKKSFIVRVRDWWKKRKQLKEDKLLGKTL